MPIGTPKVPYQLPGQQYSEWISIYTRLSLERIIFLGRSVDDMMANNIIAYLLYLDSEDPGKPIYLYINSPGGSVSAGLAIYDTMRHIKSEVITICVGLAASMGAFLLCGGTKGKRLALPHSRIMIHQPSGGAQGQATDIQIHAKNIQDTKDRLNTILAHHTGQSVEQVAADTERDNFMDPEAALKYGLIDKVLANRGA